MSGSSAFKHSIGHFLKKIIPYSEVLGLTILLQIYPFLSEIMDERGVIFSLTLHPPGIFCRSTFKKPSEQAKTDDQIFCLTAMTFTLFITCYPFDEMKV